MTSPSGQGRRVACARLCWILALSLAGGQTSFSQVHPPYPSHPKSVRGLPAFDILSDTQTPLWFEKLRLKSDGNEAAPGRIFANIAHDSTVVAVFHLGDFTALGSLSSYWEDFDDKAESIREAQVPIYPAFGNHEYIPFPSSGRANMIARFPFMDTSWYYRQIGRTAVIVLNSNFSHLSEREVSAQLLWYTTILRRIDQDTSVILTIVACHHPPYTNSTVVDPSEDVRNFFVPPFIDAGKAKLFVSGHAHAFEHFRVSGKDFLVVGGGGGLLHPLLQGSAQRVPDLYPHDSPRTFFHYLRCTVDADSLTVQALRLRSGQAGVDTAYTLRIGLRP